MEISGSQLVALGVSSPLSMSLYGSQVLRVPLGSHSQVFSMNTEGVGGVY